MKCPNADGSRCEFAVCEKHGNLRPSYCPAGAGIAMARSGLISREEARRYLSGENQGMIFDKSLIAHERVHVAQQAAIAS